MIMPLADSYHTLWETPNYDLYHCKTKILDYIVIFQRLGGKCYVKN
jgi:hypothetical protein